ncbi:hypothetical protein EYF80_063905 [Liparis tanakae]|uniref:Uncharacterized protein n=1 Tax=Liparis tanakae TaxID=230148 RepID=A0A4Z2EAW5_9TELE|nr:hypothetical protein EYF80_063905 [Liparis tanakae]
MQTSHWRQHHEMNTGAPAVRALHSEVRRSEALLHSCGAVMRDYRNTRCHPTAAQTHRGRRRPGHSGRAAIGSDRSTTSGPELSPPGPEGRGRRALQSASKEPLCVSLETMSRISFPWSFSIFFTS